MNREWGSPSRPLPIGRQRLTVDATVGGVSLTRATSARSCHMRLESGQIRFSLVTATVPTASAGRLMEVGETVELESVEEIAGFAAIRTGAASGVLDIEYFAEGAGPEAAT